VSQVDSLVGVLDVKRARASTGRHVYTRDEARCAFVDKRGKRCEETGMLELDHIDGFAETRSHDKDRVRLLCWAHNQYLAEQRYGREFMERARAARSRASRPGTGRDALTTTSSALSVELPSLPLDGLYLRARSA
jgi:hypothetical protein